MPINFRRQRIRGVELERRAWELYVDHQDWSTRTIAEELGVAQSSVVRALQRAEKRALGNVDVMRRHAFEELKRGRQHAMAAWFASIGKRTRERKKLRKGGEAGDVSEAEIVTHTDLGDPRYLAEARRCTEAMCRLAGLNAPTRVEVSEPDRPFAGLTDDEVRRELAEALREAGVDVADPPQAGTDGAVH